MASPSGALRRKMHQSNKPWHAHRQDSNAPYPPIEDGCRAVWAVTRDMPWFVALETKTVLQSDEWFCAIPAVMAFAAARPFP